MVGQEGQVRGSQGDRQRTRGVSQDVYGSPKVLTKCFKRTNKTLKNRILHVENPILVLKRKEM